MSLMVFVSLSRCASEGDNWCVSLDVVVSLLLLASIPCRAINQQITACQNYNYLYNNKLNKSLRTNRAKIAKFVLNIKNRLYNTNSLLGGKSVNRLCKGAKVRELPLMGWAVLLASTGFYWCGFPASIPCRVIAPNNHWCDVDVWVSLAHRLGDVPVCGLCVALMVMCRCGCVHRVLLLQSLAGL